MNFKIFTQYPAPELAEKWNAFLQSARFASHYVTPNYFLDPYVRGERFAVLAIDNENEIAAVMTGVHSPERIVSGLFSRPQIVFGKGVDRKKAAAALIDGVNDLGRDKRRLIELHAWEETSEFAGHGMHVRTSNDETSVIILDLSRGADVLFNEFSQTRRNEVRKTIKQNIVEVKELETDAEIAELYEIQCEWNARKGNGADSFEQLRSAAHGRENRRIFIAKVEGKVIAGSFYRFCPGGMVEYAANVSLSQFQRLRPNDLIGWRAIEWACAEGFSHFSMGGSQLFLRRFGGEIVKTYRYRRDQSLFRRYDLKENARNLGIQAYRRLPDSLRAEMRRFLT